MRRYGNLPNPSIKYIARPGAYGLFWYQGKLLLTCSIREGKFDWQLPGGGLECGEHPLPALVREAFEETGWRVSIARKITAFRRYVYMPDYDQHAEKICHIYVGQAVNRLGPPTETDHHAELVHPADAMIMLRQRAESDALALYLRQR